MAFNKVSIADKFVHSPYDKWGIRKGPVKAFVEHMAEGTNVYKYLSGPNVLRDVSVHFTVEEDGTIVQMLELSHASGSINPYTIRTDDDLDGHYGASHARFAMGGWWKDPNSACISVEVAGRAADGPNDVQVAALAKLFAFLKKKYPEIIPLGHRDFQNVKRCPGEKFWHSVYPPQGGHGKDYKPGTHKPDPEPKPKPNDVSAVMIEVTRGATLTSSHVVSLPEGTPLYADTKDSDPFYKTAQQGDYQFFGEPWLVPGWFAVLAKAGANRFADGKARKVILYTPSAGLSVTPKPVSPSGDDCAEVKANLTELQTAVTKAIDAMDAVVNDLEEAVHLS